MHTRPFITGVVGVATVGLAALATAPTIDRTTSTSTASTQYPCGYDGYQDNGQPFYNHCGRTDIVIEVDHFFWQTIYECVLPGVHRIDQRSSPWAIVNAEYDGHACSTPGQVVGP